MADRKISELTNITGANLADDDEFALVDTSADETKAITFGEFKTALDTATGFVRITGDTMTGNLTVPNVVVSGNVDGRDVSADGTKLDGIEAGADVTDTTNVTAAGALMDSELSNLAAVKAINQGLSTSDSPSFDAVTVGSTSDPSSEMTILSSIGGTSELRLGDTDADAGSIKYFNSNDQLVLRAAAATRVIFSSTGAAITGKTTTDELDLNAIAATISDTAVDIFVYDTRKDSDGGAWRKRTQHTSWYNETLNTATRGSRKEFPSVAVIVVNSDTGQNLPHITIYDGDDPDLPMWMEFTRVSQDPYINSYTNGATMVGNYPVGAVFAKNGVLALGSARSAGALSGLNAGLRVINFVSDSAIAHSNTDAYAFPNDISQRDILVDAAATSGAIVNVNANDVAMTVLPNAPIDAATGLSVPTIAVATDGGTSIIRDDGTVVDITSGSYGQGLVSFVGDSDIMLGVRNTAGTKQSLYNIYMPIPSLDTTIGTSVVYNNVTTSGSAGNYIFNTANQIRPSIMGSGAFDQVVTPDGTQIIGTQPAAGYSDDSRFGGGVSYFERDRILTNNTGTVSQAAITSTWNSGWMNGQIKLATLSDTDDTNVTGSELVTNGDFSSATGWSVPTGVSISGGVATFSSPSHGSNLQQTATSFVSGKTYTISVEVTAFTSGGITIYANYSSGTSTTVAVSKLRSVGLHSFTWTAAGDGTGFSLQADAASNGACILTLDNVSVRLAEADRSVNGNGLQVFGTVTKTAVATGADLVAYSGFSASNYLRQPYNSDLDFGTGDFCYIWWADIPTTTFQTHFTREHHNGSSFVGASLEVFSDNATNKLKIFMSDDGFATYDNWVSSSTISGMQCFAVVRQGNVIHTYINGSLDNTHTISAPSGSMNNSDATLSVGVQRNNGSANTTGSIALLRASATAPSPEQIAKIYEDEKFLFQENAQATLYGSSDAVTALAYDDTTELLHVGTSAGRSVFQGLRRVDNTTDAVGAAISASNGLVADE